MILTIKNRKLFSNLLVKKKEINERDFKKATKYYKIGIYSPMIL